MSGLNYLLIGVILLLLLIIVTSFIKRKQKRWRIKRKSVRGYRKEAEAAKILLRKGYTIIEEQPVLEAVYLIDGVEQIYSITPDYLVKKWWSYYYVEVKTGLQADLKNSKTRRQILEYLYASNTRKVLFVDMELKKIHKIARKM